MCADGMVKISPRKCYQKRSGSFLTGLDLHAWGISTIEVNCLNHEPLQRRHQPTIMSSPHESHFTEPTDNRILDLPIRPLATNSSEAVASLLINQASFTVVSDLAIHLTNLIRPYQPEISIGLPTLGLTLAPLVAQGLGHTRYVPMGYSRKFWYTKDLSTAVSSITSPGVGEKRVYLDPHLLPLIRGKRVAIIDDAVSLGGTLSAVWGY
jgi:adenine/guanine phosphoribosyltransferase-like PRPP-binding protein